MPESSSAADTPLLVSIHVPKTGGITLGSILEKRFGPRLQLAYETSDDPVVPNPACVHGHAVLPRFQALLDAHPNAQWITFLRDPLAGAISHYFWTRKQWGEGESAHFEDRGLEHWLTHEEPYRWPSPPGYRHDRYAAWLEGLGRDLDSFDFVGLTDEFDRSMLLLYREFGWPLLGYRAKNRGKYTREEVSGPTAARFRELNQRDYALVERARERLEQAQVAYGHSFTSDLTNFERRLRRPRWLGGIG